MTALVLDYVAVLAPFEAGLAAKVLLVKFDHARQRGFELANLHHLADCVPHLPSGLPADATPCGEEDERDALGRVQDKVDGLQSRP